MSFTSLKDLLPQAVRHAGVDASVSAAKVVDIAQSTAATLFPLEQRRFIHPVSFVDGTLRVAISAPSAAHVIRIRGMKWIEEMNRVIGMKRIQKIAVQRRGF